MKEIELLVDGHHGIYVAQVFAQTYGDGILERHPELKDNMDILLAGPDHEYYLDAWADLSGWNITDDKGDPVTIESIDGDLWLVPDGMVWDEQRETYIDPDDPNLEPIDADNI